MDVDVDTDMRESTNVDVAVTSVWDACVSTAMHKLPTNSHVQSNYAAIWSAHAHVCTGSSMHMWGMARLHRSRSSRACTCASGLHGSPSATCRLPTQTQPCTRTHTHLTVRSCPESHHVYACVSAVPAMACTQAGMQPAHTRQTKSLVHAHQPTCTHTVSRWCACVHVHAHAWRVLVCACARARAPN